MKLADLILADQRSRLAMEFDNLQTFAAHLVLTAAFMKRAQRLILGEAANIVKKEARAEIGVYQQQSGNYPEWEQLAENTLDSKASAGVTPKAGMDEDAPLYRYGDLLKSFRSEIETDESVIIGSTDPVMEYHEFGTSKMPPRPVLGPALFNNIDEIKHLAGVGMVEAIMVGQRMGYRFNETHGVGDTAD